MMDFTKKVVVVTGGTDGIGKALVIYFLNAKAKVATCARNNDKLYELATNFAGYPLHTEVCDVSKEEDCSRFIQHTIDTFGTIDILINNAGISMRSLVAESTIDTMRKVMDVNFMGTIYCTKYALPYLIAAKGSVVGISSIAGYRGLPGRSAYSASKFALNGWLEALRLELKHMDVHVLTAAPGFVKSSIRNVALNAEGENSAKSLMNEDKLMSPEQCAEIIAKAIAHKKRTVTMTALGKFTVFINKFLPKLADSMVYKRYFKNGTLIQ
jgi:short-subunit dehydrogenase